MASSNATQSDKIADNATQMAELESAMKKMLRAGKGEAAISTLMQLIDTLQRDNSRLAARAAAAERARFGRRSEKLTAEELGQLALALGATPHEAAMAEPLVPTFAVDEEDAGEDSEPEPKPRKKRKHKGRSRLDPGLARHVTVTDVPADERGCIHCGKEMQTIGHVDHERVEFIPARIEVYIERREKVACRDCRQDINVAPRRDVLPASNPSTKDDLLPGAGVRRRAGASLLAHLLEAKGDDALPVHRQRDQLRRLGFDVPLNTLYGYWQAAAKLIQPIAQMVLSEVLGQAIVGVDDTRLDWLDPAEHSRRKRGHLWCFTGTTGLVAFDFTETWCAEDLAPWLRAIDGYIQCDDYKGYAALLPGSDGERAPLVPPERRLGCWMHVRRRFHKAFKAGEKHAIIALNYIKSLYEIEAEARSAGLSCEQRGALRANKSQPIARDFFAWVREQSKSARPTSYLGEALAYALGQEEFVLRCLTDGRFELDTGRVERQIREPVVGRKNYLFSGSADAARLLAGVYTLICSCRNLGINTREYLIDVLTKLEKGFPLRQINDLRPDVWAAHRAANQLAQ